MPKNFCRGDKKWLLSPSSSDSNVGGSFCAHQMYTLSSGRWWMPISDNCAANIPPFNLQNAAEIQTKKESASVKQFIPYLPNLRLISYSLCMHTFLIYLSENVLPSPQAAEFHSLIGIWDFFVRYVLLGLYCSLMITFYILW